jgi:glycogen debranching enzyme
MAEGVHEDLDLVNYSLKPIGFNLEIAIRADFADLFEVKSHRPIRRGRIETEWDSNAGELRTSYSNRDFHRCLIYRIGSDAHADYANGRITLPIELQPGASWHVCCEYLLGEGGNLKNPKRTCLLKTEETRFDRLQHEWLEQATVFTSANEDLYRLFRQSVEDMGALRLYGQDSADSGWLPAAGIPWFATIFGRDSLIVSLQNMMINPGFARGALSLNPKINQAVRWYATRS